MDIQLRPLSEQVVVITGASSGVGLVTARLAAARGARVVLAARNERDLARAVDEIRAAGGRAIHVVTDVSDEGQVEALADAAVREFGRIDTWVNNAAVSVYGRIMDLETADMRRQFDVNYWGTAYGSRAAVRRLRAQRDAGAIVNVASAVADRAIPLQGNYCAAKHAIKGFTDTLRMELEEEGVPISLTLVKPGSMDTPFFQKAKTLMGVEPKPIPPVYAPEVCAEAILHCAEHPVRDIVVGGMGKVLQLAAVAPRLADRYMERTTFDGQLTDKPVADGRPDNLYAPVEHDGGERGRNWDGRTKGTSVYTWAALHPGSAALAAGVIGVAAVGALRALRGAPIADAPRADVPLDALPPAVDGVAGD